MEDTATGDQLTALVTEVFAGRLITDVEALDRELAAELAPPPKPKASAAPSRGKTSARKGASESWYST